MQADALKAFILKELETDRASDDVTARLLGSRGEVLCEATVFAKESGVFCGESVCAAFPDTVVSVECLVRDGAVLEVGTPVARVRGTAAACLSHERTLLNLLSHLSGIATQTRKFVQAVGPFKTKILATRKTLPGLRDLQLQGVRAGGGHIHRRSLSDGILVKDNHLVFIPEGDVVARAKSLRSPLHRVEVEVQSLEQLERLMVNPPDVVMLDNFSLEDTRVAIGRVGGRCEIEVSGGMSLDRVAELAALGVDYLSVGRLTHSAAALDLSLDIRALDARLV